MDNNDQICASMDVQGFQIGKMFYARELAVVSDNFETVIEFNSAVNLTKKFHRKCSTYQTRNIHGLSVRAVDRTAPSSNDIDSVIYTLYKVLRNNKAQVVVCKNRQLSHILERLSIPHLSFTGTTMAHKSDLCLNHTEVSNISGRLRCAHWKAHQIWESIKHHGEIAGEFPFNMCL